MIITLQALADEISKLKETIYQMKVDIIELRDGLSDSDELLKTHDQELEAISEVVFISTSPEEMDS